jgi:2'-hydroxyisoflavone reductase
MQLVDARDLAAFMLDAGESGTGGTFNATGPRGNATMGSWLEDCVAATGSDATLTWVDDGFLLEREVQPWSELPLWMPRGQDGDHVWDAETAAAELAGLRSRPVTETVRDTWAWLQDGGRAPDQPPHAHVQRHGIDPDKERRILTDWHATT